MSARHRIVSTPLYGYHPYSISGPPVLYTKIIRPRGNTQDFRVQLICKTGILNISSLRYRDYTSIFIPLIPLPSPLQPKPASPLSMYPLTVFEL